MQATPIVSSISPARGSTEGGTRVTIDGSGFGGASTTKANVSVSIAGIPCNVTSLTHTSNGSRLSCTTGRHGATSAAAPGVGAVDLFIDGLGGAAAATAAAYQYVDLWSSRTTWGGAAPPVLGDSVSIPDGQHVLLDISPPRLYAVIVQGALTFDRVDLALNASYIFVQGGSLTVGTEEEPFLQKAVITLHGSPVSQELPMYGAKVLG